MVTSFGHLPSITHDDLTTRLAILASSFLLSSWPDFDDSISAIRLVSSDPRDLPCLRECRLEGCKRPPTIPVAFASSITIDIAGLISALKAKTLSLHVDVALLAMY
mmetsp:Transcript_26747/g.73239  ORF Transcript_26747/g.73239 Transcript_26747/m.73239 type:complete len:106 (+) Transcript_26747:386-703(+)